MNWENLTQKKKELDSFRPLPPALVENLERWFLIELTYTSNAIEGNTLTRQETAVVVEKGLTVSGKSLVEHLEATNHAKALEGVLSLAQDKTVNLTEQALLKIHETILRGIDDENAGSYRRLPVRISGSLVVLPNHQKVPDKMTAFMDDLSATSKIHPVELAAKAHYELVTIHPFIDGNGRTARLLMNLILLQHGYPPAFIRKRDRLKYLKALETAQLGGSIEDFYQLIAQAVDRSFTIYLNALTDTEEKQITLSKSNLLKIGQLAKLTGETNATLRYWTKEDLLKVAETTEAGYQLYAKEMAERVKKIRVLQKERYTLKEIKSKLEQ